MTKVIKQNDKYLNSAETDMLKGNFEHAIDNYLKVDIEKLSSNDKNKVRSGLSFAYFHLLIAFVFCSTSMRFACFSDF